jgi:hypothetical protein
MKEDVNSIIKIIKNPIPYNLVSINTEMCTKYPDVFNVSNGNLVPVTREFLENTSQYMRIWSLAVIMDCIKSLIVSEKVGKIITDVGKAVASHFIEAAITTLIKGEK